MPLDQMDKLISISKPSMLIFFNNHPDPSTGIQSDEVVKVGQPKSMSLKIGNHFQLIESCNKIPTNQQCLAQCRAMSIYEQCSCRPLIFERDTMDNFSKQIVFCTLESYQNCQLTNDANCSSKCHSDCNKKTYVTTEFGTDSAVAESDATFKYFGRFQAITVYSDYPVFEEQYAQTFLSFLGELGRVLDLWLGISTIAIVHFGFFIVKQVIYMFDKNTKTGGSIRTGKANHHKKLAVTDFLMAKEQDQETIGNINTVEEQIEHLSQKIEAIKIELQRLSETKI